MEHPKLSFLSLPLLLAVPAYIAILTVIVFVHEMGHYLVARWNGVAIQTFSLGFGPEVAGFDDRHGTRWKISMIPLGGYVRFVGDMNAASMPDDAAVAEADPAMRPRLFVNKNVWQRIAVVAAGPLANLIFTFVVLYALLLAYGQYTIPPIVSQVTAGGVAASAGIEAGDKVLSIDGYNVRGFEDVQRLVSTSPGRQVSIVLQRAGETKTISLVPAVSESVDRFGNANRVGLIGIGSNAEASDVTWFRPSPIEAAALTVDQMRFIVDRTVGFISDFFVGRGDIQQLGGPVKVAKVSGEVATLGIVALVNLAAYISLNIGIVNLLPIPVLDGGHLLYYVVEALRGRPLSPRAQDIGFRVGFAIVGTLMIFSVLNDTVLEALRHFG